MGYGYEYVYLIMNILKLAARVSNFLTCVSAANLEVGLYCICLELKEEEDFPVLSMQ